MALSSQAFVPRVVVRRSAPQLNGFPPGRSSQLVAAPKNWGYNSRALVESYSRRLRQRCASPVSSQQRHHAHTSPQSKPSQPETPAFRAMQAATSPSSFISTKLPKQLSSAAGDWLPTNQLIPSTLTPVVASSALFALIATDLFAPGFPHILLTLDQIVHDAVMRYIPSDFRNGTADLVISNAAIDLAIVSSIVSVVFLSSR